jgi:RNA polymerase sigma-B factor
LTTLLAVGGATASLTNFGEGPMTADADDRQLLRRWREDGDEGARLELVERTLPLARTLARRYANKGESLDDLEQVAALGLVKAIERFDLEREVRFTTFAVPTISGEIKRHFRDRGWMLRVPRDVQELSARVGVARERLTREQGRSPSVPELAGAARATVEQVLEAIGAAYAYRTLSLDEPLGEGIDALDSIGGPDRGFERVEQRFMLRSGLTHLPAREREILHLRFYEGLTQREIADRIGVSQMHVSRLIRRSIEALRERLAVPVTVQAV